MLTNYEKFQVDLALAKAYTTYNFSLACDYLHKAITCADNMTGNERKLAVAEYEQVRKQYFE